MITLLIFLQILILGAVSDSPEFFDGGFYSKCFDNEEGWMSLAGSCIYPITNFQETSSIALQMCGALHFSTGYREIDWLIVKKLQEKLSNETGPFWTGLRVVNNETMGLEEEGASERIIYPFTSIYNPLWAPGQPPEGIPPAEYSNYCVALTLLGWILLPCSSQLPILCQTYACLNGTFRCLDNSKCIPLGFVGDGFNDCLDGSDEVIRIGARHGIGYWDYQQSSKMLQTAVETENEASTSSICRLPSVINGVISSASDKIFYTTTITITCQIGFFISPTFTSLRCASGTWYTTDRDPLSTDKVICYPMRCPLSTDIEDDPGMVPDSYLTNYGVIRRYYSDPYRPDPIRIAGPTYRNGTNWDGTTELCVCTGRNAAWECYNKDIKRYSDGACLTPSTKDAYFVASVYFTISSDLFYETGDQIDRYCYLCPNYKKSFVCNMGVWIDKTTGKVATKEDLMCDCTNSDEFQDPCGPHGKFDDVTGYCSCEPWYRSIQSVAVDENTCIDINECEEGSDWCDGTASCVNQNPGFSCDCPDGYELFTGSAEQLEAWGIVEEYLAVNYSCVEIIGIDSAFFISDTNCDYCSSEHTVGCLTNQPPYTNLVYCQCKDAYIGRDCSTSNFCENNGTYRCLNGGTCSGGQCQCTPDFTGTNCEFYNETSQCSTDCENGVCRQMNATDRHGYCNCYDGWTRMASGACNIVEDLCTLNNPCQQGGTCHWNETTGEIRCDCVEGWTGAYCQTPSTNDCSLCQNGATCLLNFDRHNFCQCAPGFSGPHCTEHKNPCVYTPCLNGGTCTVILEKDDDNGNYQSYHCTCPEEWSGESCEVDLRNDTITTTRAPLDPICELVTVVNGAVTYASDDLFINTTIVSETTITCEPITCPATARFDPYWKPDTFTISYGAIRRYPVTMRKGNNWDGATALCVCDGEWECFNADIQESEDYACLSPEAKNAYFVERDDNEVVTVLVYFDGDVIERYCFFCSNYKKSFICYMGVWIDKTTGQVATEEDLMCDCTDSNKFKDPCGPHGKFDDVTGYCNCDPWYRSIQSVAVDENTCRDINECEEGSDWCDGTASCVNRSPGFSCDCPDGYELFTGSTEQLEAWGIVEEYLAVNYSCVEIIGTDSAFLISDTNCDYCSSEHTVGCLTNQPPYTNLVYCQCKDGYIGRDCSTSNFCENNGTYRCLNGGTCSGGQCQCTPDFTGTNCEFHNETSQCSKECDKGVCRLTANTDTDYGQSYCNCDDGWMKVAWGSCSSITDLCPNNNPCQQGGTCHWNETTGQMSCVCVEGWTGDYCQTLITNNCTLCQNGATCLSEFIDRNDYCVCSPGFSGTYCADNRDPCFYSPCVNGGTCTVFLDDTPNGDFDNYKCECPVGKAGRNCEFDDGRTTHIYQLTTTEPFTDHTTSPTITPVATTEAPPVPFCRLPPVLNGVITFVSDDLFITTTIIITCTNGFSLPQNLTSLHCSSGVWYTANSVFPQRAPDLISCSPLSCPEVAPLDTTYTRDSNTTDYGSIRIYTDSRRSGPNWNGATVMCICYGKWECFNEEMRQFTDNMCLCPTINDGYFGVPKNDAVVTSTVYYYGDQVVRDCYFCPNYKKSFICNEGVWIDKTTDNVATKEDLMCDCTNSDEFKDPCGPHGKFDDVTGYCSCDPWYRSIQSVAVDENTCKDINECEEGSDWCDGTASCVNQNPGFSCDCPDGYELFTGSTEQLEAWGIVEEYLAVNYSCVEIIGIDSAFLISDTNCDYCSSEHTVRCLTNQPPYTNLVYCQCKDGYIGRDCSTSNFCENNGTYRCLNGGTCVGGQCQCTSDFTGTNCETFEPFSFSCNKSCQHGSCRLSDIGTYCNCDDGWMKTATGSCNLTANLCEYNNPCQQGGTCHWNETTGQMRCDCVKGWTGAYCQTLPRTVCDFCQNGAPCLPNFNGPSYCQCPPKVSGTFCTEYITPCTYKPCLNGGTCTVIGKQDIDGIFYDSHCTCPESSSGRNCEVLLVTETSTTFEPTTTTTALSTESSTDQSTSFFANPSFPTEAPSITICRLPPVINGVISSVSDDLFITTTITITCTIGFSIPQNLTSLHCSSGEWYTTDSSQLLSFEITCTPITCPKTAPLDSKWTRNNEKSEYGVIRRYYETMRTGNNWDDATALCVCDGEWECFNEEILSSEDYQCIQPYVNDAWFTYVKDNKYVMTSVLKNGDKIDRNCVRCTDNKVSLVCNKGVWTYVTSGQVATEEDLMCDCTNSQKFQDPCGPNGKFNDVTGYCSCDPWYRSVGMVRVALDACEEIDACAEESDWCDGTASCVNRSPGFSCDCPDGYELFTGSAEQLKNWGIIEKYLAVNYSCVEIIGTDSKLTMTQKGHGCEFCHTDNTEKCLTNQEPHPELVYCLCKENWIGRQCTTNSFCSNNGTYRCLNGGTCLSNHCECAPDFTGTNCETHLEINECPRECVNGVCRIINGFYCNCDDGWTRSGEACSAVKNLCDYNNPCQQGGTCHWNETTGQMRCDCVKGWTGDYCQTLPPTDCSLCQNGATCLSEFNGPSFCQCAPGFSGAFCTDRKDPCVYKPCLNGGTCTVILDDTPNGDFDNYNETYNCTCPIDWLGASCELKLDIDFVSLTVHNPTVGPFQCSSCSHSTGCHVINGTIWCECLSGFSSELCDVVDDVCAVVECQNGGSCADGECHCKDPFGGKYCEINQDQCYLNQVHCQNGGSCDWKTGTCNCPEHTIGPFCDNKITQCHGYLCNYSGRCTNNSTCQCPSGTSGDTCHIGLPCEEDYCRNGGTCRELPSGASCDCQKGWVGRQCEAESSFNYNLVFNGLQYFPRIRSDPFSTSGNWTVCSFISYNFHADINLSTQSVPDLPPYLLINGTYKLFLDNYGYRSDNSTDRKRVTITTDTWHHFCLVKSVNLLITYLDGIPQFNQSIDNGLITDLVLDPLERFQGMTSMVELYQKVLDEAEIGELAYNCYNTLITDNSLSTLISWQHNFTKVSSTNPGVFVDPAGICNLMSCMFGRSDNGCEKDRMPPTVTRCPTDIRLKSGTCYRKVSWNDEDVAFFDNIGVIRIWSDYQNGQQFGVGITTVRYIASDAAGNTAECSFNVIISQNPCPRVTVVDGNLTTVSTDKLGPFVISAITTTCDDKEYPTDKSRAFETCDIMGQWSSGTQMPDGSLIISNCGSTAAPLNQSIIGNVAGMESCVQLTRELKDIVKGTVEGYELEIRPNCSGSSEENDSNGTLIALEFTLAVRNSTSPLKSLLSIALSSSNFTYFSLDSSVSCDPLHPITVLGNTTICISCPAGTWANGYSCTPCAKDTYRNPGDSDQSKCLPCPENTTTGGKTGSIDVSQCYKNCEMGEFEDSGECVPCPEGTFSSVRGLQKCVCCGFDTSTFGGGKTSRSDCEKTCPSGQQMERTDGSVPICVDCPVGFYKQGSTGPCLQCPRGLTTVSRASKSIDSCSVFDCIDENTRKGIRPDVSLAFDKICPTCEAGTFQNTSNSDSCYQCSQLSPYQLVLPRTCLSTCSPDIHIDNCDCEHQQDTLYWNCKREPVRAHHSTMKTFLGVFGGVTLGLILAVLIIFRKPILSYIRGIHWTSNQHVPVSTFRDIPNQRLENSETASEITRRSINTPYSNPNLITITDNDQLNDNGDCGSLESFF